MDYRLRLAHFLRLPYRLRKRYSLLGVCDRRKKPSMLLRDYPFLGDVHRKLPLWRQFSDFLDFPTHLRPHNLRLQKGFMHLGLGLR